jgi:hypothetical protein
MPPTHTLVSVEPAREAAARPVPEAVECGAGLELETDELATARGMLLGAALGLVCLAGVAAFAWWLL